MTIISQSAAADGTWTPDVPRGPLSEDARLILRAALAALTVADDDGTFVGSRVASLRGSLEALAERADDADLNVRVWEVRAHTALDGIGGGRPTPAPVCASWCPGVHGIVDPCRLTVGTADGRTVSLESADGVVEIVQVGMPGEVRTSIEDAKVRTEWMREHGQGELAVLWDEAVTIAGGVR